jgi:hypothetical protein
LLLHTVCAACILLLLLLLLPLQPVAEALLSLLLDCTVHARSDRQSPEHCLSGYSKL